MSVGLTVDMVYRFIQTRDSFQRQVYLTFLFEKTFFRIQPSPFSKYFSQNLKKCALSVDQSAMSHSLYT